MANNESLDKQQKRQQEKKDGKRWIVVFFNKTDADGVIEPSSVSSR